MWLSSVAVLFLVATIPGRRIIATAFVYLDPECDHRATVTTYDDPVPCLRFRSINQAPGWCVTSVQAGFAPEKLMNFSEVCIKRNDYWIECRCPQGYFSCNEDIQNWMTLNKSIHCFWDMKYYANITQYERYHEWLAKSKTTLPATSTTTTSTSSITFTNTTTSTTKNIAESLPAAGASTISDDSSPYREAKIEARKKTAFKLFMLSTCMACVLFVQLIFIRMLRNAYRQQYEEYVRNQMELQAKQALSSEAPEAVIRSSGSSSNSSEKRPRFAPMNKRSAEQLSQLLKSAVTPAAAKSPMQLEEYLPGIDSYVPASKRNHKD